MKRFLSRMSHCAFVLSVILSVPPTLLAGTKAITRAERPVKGQYLVMLKKDVSDLKRVGTRIAKAHGGKAVDFFRNINTMLVFMTDAQARSMTRNPLVTSIERNGVKQVAAITSPQTGLEIPPSGTPNSWGLDRIDQAYYSLPRLDGSYRWGFDGTGSQIYIVDTGVAPWHPEFGGPNASRVQYRQALGQLLASLPANDPPNELGIPNNLPMTQCWNLSPRNFSVNAAHGTAVASIAAGETFGVAKGATIIDARGVGCDGRWTVYRIMKVIEWIGQDPERIPGRAVVNMSFNGLVIDNDVPPDGITALMAQISYAAVQLGIPIVISAGNQGTDVVGVLPGNGSSSITVGGLARLAVRNPNTDMAWPSSNFGNPISFYAPAEFIQSATTCSPRIVDAYGREQFAGCSSAPPDRALYRSELPDCQGFSCTSGTSFAAPHMSGVIARRLQWIPGQTWQDMMDDFTRTASVWVHEEQTGRYVPVLTYVDFRPY